MIKQIFKSPFLLIGIIHKYLGIIVEWLHRFWYFTYKSCTELPIIKWLWWLIIKTYEWTLIIFLVLFTFFIIFKTRWHIKDYELIQNIISENELMFYYSSIIIFSFIILRNIAFLYKFIQNYLVKWPTFFSLLWVFMIISNSDVEGKIYILSYIFVLISILAILAEFKWITKINNSQDKTLYYINSYKKVYKKTIPKQPNNKVFSKWYLHRKKKHYKKYVELAKKYNEKWNYIEPINDDPITLGNDIFWFREYVRNIYNLINGINTQKLNGSYSIWIVWEWWWWKSSILNLLHEDYIDWKENLIYYKFNPWNYTMQNLTEKFLNDLSQVLEKHNISNEIKAYLSSLQSLWEEIKLISNALNVLIPQRNIEELKTSINNSLEKLDKKVIFCIDDLDRCEPEEVLLMLNIIKNLGDFKNIIYLVSYDKKHIVDVLEKKWFEWIYIDKIVNMERYIPQVSSDQIEEYFLSQLSTILKSIKVNLEIEKTQEALNEVYTIFHLENLRFLKKLLNQIHTILQINYDGWNIGDLDDKNLWNIILINYVRLKDYVFFERVISIIKSTAKDTTTIEKNDIILINKCPETIQHSFLSFFNLEIVNDKHYWIMILLPNSSFHNLKFVQQFS